MNDKPKAQALKPRGFVDRDRADIAAADAMMAKIREVYALYGFEAVETPFVEYTQALGKFLPDLDRPNEGVFSFQDDDEQWLSLRYDLTAPLARYVAENYERLAKPYRSYRAGWVFRNEKPGPGRFRQFMQFDADTVGASSPAADAEICMMAADCLEALGVRRGDYVVKVNNRKVLDGVMEAIGLGGAENAGRRLTVLRAIDKLDRLGPQGVRLLLGSGRKDESGDFTKGADLSDDKISKLMQVFKDINNLDSESFDQFLQSIGLGGEGHALLRQVVRGNIEKLETFTLDLVRKTIFESVKKADVSMNFAAGLADEQINMILFILLNHGPFVQEFEYHGPNIEEEYNKNFRMFGRDIRATFSPEKMLDEWQVLLKNSAVGCAGIDELRAISSLVRSSGYLTNRIRLDPSVVRGLEYYTGPVFEAELTFEVKDESGRPVRFGSVGGGGRYDGLVARFRDEPVPATGFSVGVSRLLSALKAINSPIVAQAAQPGPVVVLAMDRDRMGDYQKLAAALRAAGLAAEVYLGDGKMNAQLKYADKRGSLVAVIQGSNEREAAGGPQVVVRDLALGAELAKANKERADYLEMRAKAQTTIAENQMVEQVREILARGGKPMLG